MYIRVQIIRYLILKARFFFPFNKTIFKKMNGEDWKIEQKIRL